MIDIPEELRLYIIINKSLADCFKLYLNIFNDHHLSDDCNTWILKVEKCSFFQHLVPRV